MIPELWNTQMVDDPLLGFDGEPIVWIDYVVYDEYGNPLGELDGDKTAIRMMNDAFNYELMKNNGIE